jgi:predicted nucleotidyltransferase component of viral defense system
MSLDPDVINEIAIELGIDPAFVEKDWHSVQVLKALAAHESEDITTIFSGGTSLSKGHGLLQRFSEDLDFRCLYQNEHTNNQKKKLRSEYKASIISTVQGIELISLDQDTIQAASNYIKFPLIYPQDHPGHGSLRPHLEVEFSFTQPRLLPIKKQIQSFISQFTNSEPETSILCLSVVETGADKLSALTWRVLKRNRTDENDDSTMVRHLHDLSALKSILETEKSVFVKTANEAFEEDQKSRKRAIEQDFHCSMKNAFQLLKNDAKYQAEYSQFVDAMSYADDEERIDFKGALNSIEELINYFS